MISNEHDVLNLNWLFLILNQSICKQQSVIPTLYYSRVYSNYEILDVLDLLDLWIWCNYEYFISLIEM